MFIRVVFNLALIYTLSAVNIEVKDGVREPVLFLPWADDTVQDARQAVQEDPCRNLSQNTGLDFAACLLFFVKCDHVVAFTVVDLFID
jgi:hypothetical protein